MQKSNFKESKNIREDIQESFIQSINHILVSIIIPLYNEESSIKNVIKRIPNNFNHEIIIIDDGSTDNSLRKIKEIENSEIKIIRHKENRGYGAAIMSGIRYAQGDIIVTMDSDG